MKKLLILVALLATVFTLTGCQEDTTQWEPEKYAELNVTDTFSNEFITLRTYELIEDPESMFGPGYCETKIEFELNDDYDFDAFMLGYISTANDPDGILLGGGGKLVVEPGETRIWYIDTECSQGETNELYLNNWDHTDDSFMFVIEFTVPGNGSTVVASDVIYETVIVEEVIEEIRIWEYTLRENRITALDTFTTYCDVLNPSDCSEHQDYTIELVWEETYTFIGMRAQVEDVVNTYLDTEDFNDDLFVGATIYSN